ncbi:sodium:proton antiporter [Duganella sp. Root198D2]|uniref:cation:proton antiporter n=1 Tax=Duganella sp. Root198D2 TaxID=1736489 RepID=UPI0009EBB570|nr:cation:proton antiporter [Duganella sp. Root198D2]
MSIATWVLLGGLILIALMLIGTLVVRLPLSGAMIYLGLGVLLSPYGFCVLDLDPIAQAASLELVAEAALLISLFSVGLKLEVPIRDRRWIAPYRLAFLSMAVTVGVIAVIGVYGMGLPPGVAILLGGILAPADPVLASAIQSRPRAEHDAMRFSLAGEGALNDGTAFPLVLLGLGIMRLHDLGEWGWSWWLVDVLWSTICGMLMGTLIGALLGKLVIHLRTRHHSAIGMDEFLSLGVIAVSFGAAQSCLASGFLSVFFAGLALRRARNFPLAGTMPMSRVPGAHEHDAADPATHSHHANAVIARAVHGVNEQLERFAELGMVMMIGAMLPAPGSLTSLWWFVPLVFLVVRPASVVLGMAGAGVSRYGLVLVGWLGIRRIGSIYYLVFALNHGVAEAFAPELVSLTLGTVAASILAHGITVQPLMAWYEPHPAKLAAVGTRRQCGARFGVCGARIASTLQWWRARNCCAMIKWFAEARRLRHSPKSTRCNVDSSMCWFRKYSTA